ncbi:MAG: tRNA pseudouridine(55) synthase TruB [Candidatus Wallbacteria bacterium]|nr:tRNA pseudouridine(55) synthase TruB [Candidatus Wallbacteria bacterium]
MLDGVLIVHKPAGVTSHDVVDFARRLLGGVKAGHCGTLDPAATGVLLVCLGKATRLAEYLMGGRKVYRARILLDRRTDTGDLEGEVTGRFEPAGGAPDEARIDRALELFRGGLLQRPHRVSAVRVNGKRLYEHARSKSAGGDAPEAKPRPIVIHRLQRLSFEYPRLELEVECSAGTYIRQLAEDLGEALGLGGCLENLVRTRSGPAVLADARTPFELASLAARGAIGDAIVPAKRLLESFGEARVEGAALAQVSHGAPLSRADVTDFLEPRDQDLVKLIAAGDALVAIYRLTSTDRLEPCKVLI